MHGERRPSRSGCGGDGAGRPDRVAHRLYAHLAWGTLGGLPLVDPGRAGALEGQLISLGWRLGIEPVSVRVFPDAVHLLFRFPPGRELGEIARAVKAGSGEWLRAEGSAARWAPAYTLTTVGPEGVRGLKGRIARSARERLTRSAGVG